MISLRRATRLSTAMLFAAALPATLKAILAETGRVYAPLMAANAQAVMAGADRVDAEIDGQPWSQQPFPYQAKCLGWLREEYAALPIGDRVQLVHQLVQDFLADFQINVSLEDDTASLCELRVQRDAERGCFFPFRIVH